MLEISRLFNSSVSFALIRLVFAVIQNSSLASADAVSSRHRSRDVYGRLVLCSDLVIAAIPLAGGGGGGGGVVVWCCRRVRGNIDLAANVAAACANVKSLNPPQSLGPQNPKPYAPEALKVHTHTHTDKRNRSS